MFWTKERREGWKDGATVFSLLVTPVVVAIGGWYIQKAVADGNARIQKSIAEGSVGATYVGIAASILRESPDEKNPLAQDLRKWSVDVIDSLAPIKLTAQTRKFLYEKRLGGYQPLPKFGSEVLIPDCDRVPEKEREKCVAGTLKFEVPLVTPPTTRMSISGVPYICTQSGAAITCLQAPRKETAQP